MKSLFKNSLYYVMYRLINVVYPLITATYISRVLKPAGVGEAALAQYIVIFLVAVALLGIPSYGVRAVSKANKYEINSLFTELFLINFCSTVVVSVIYFTLINTPLFPYNKTLYSIYGIILLLNVINVDWFYQGKEEFKYITIRSAIVKVLSIVEIFVFVKTENDICIYGIIFALAYAGNYLFNAINLRRFVKLSFVKLNIKRHLNTVFVLAITSISNEIYVTLDTFMLGILSTTMEIGYYSNSMKLTRIVISVVTSLGTVVLPRLNMLKHEGKIEQYNTIINKAFKNILWITIPCTLGIVLTADQLTVVLFGADFIQAANIMRVLALLIIPRAFSNISLQVLICSNMDGKTSKIYLFGMLINAILNSLLIRLSGAQGAAIASVISEICICIALLLYATKQFKLYMSIRFIISTLFATTLLALVVALLIKHMIINSFNMITILSVSIVFGSLTYGMVSLLTKNEVVLFLISKLKTFSKNFLR